MWQSATAFAELLARQQHLLFGGLGEAIAVIVGGVVSVITMRKVTRSGARPAPTPAPVSRRPAAPPAYGAPAPPTAPARRLHPGPVSLSSPTPPSPTPKSSTSERHAESEDEAPLSSLFNPEIFERPQPAPPMLRPISAITAEWRAQAAARPALDLTSHLTTPAPIWNRAPFARPAAPEAAAHLALEVASNAAVIAPPIWRRPATSAPDVMPGMQSMEAERPALAEKAPIWGSRLSAASDTADDARDVRPAERLEAPSEAANDEPNPPIWSSFLRRE